MSAIPTAPGNIAAIAGRAANNKVMVVFLVLEWSRVWVRAVASIGSNANESTFPTQKSKKLQRQTP